MFMDGNRPMKRLPMVRSLAVVCAVFAAFLFTADRADAQFVQQGGKLVGTGAAGPEVYQGTSVALSADGSTAVQGGPWDANGIGAAWVFVHSGSVWAQQGGKLVGSDTAGGLGWQGSSVALSADGSTAIVGALPGYGGVGAARVFTRSGGVWTQQGAKLTLSGAGPNGIPYGIASGLSVAISSDGNTALVGYMWDADGVGAAWVFTRSGGLWSQQGPKLVGTGGEGWTAQGASVAISADGNTALVGGPNNGSREGAAWVFTRSGGVWAQQGDKLVGAGADDGMWFGRQGASVALSADGNTAVVGAPHEGAWGAAWVFTRSGGVWTQQGEKLVGSGIASTVTAHTTGCVAVSGDGDTLAIGRPHDDGGRGAAWVFTRSGGAWTQLGDKLVGAGALGLAGQGSALALSADGAVAILGGSVDGGGTGAAWIFARQGGTSALWVPVVANTPGLKGSQWQSDLGLLNAGAATANVRLKFHGPDGVVTNDVYVPAGTQSLLVDVVGQLAAQGQGALEIAADQPLKVTSRTYHKASADDACGPYGTKGQSYPTLAAGDGLSEGQEAWLPHLAENAGYRTNIGLVNSSRTAANVTVELYDGAGTLLTSYAVDLPPGQWAQETQPFTKKAGQAAMDRGYAKVRVTSGSGVSAFASVIDNITNDPTTVTMQR